MALPRFGNFAVKSLHSSLVVLRLYQLQKSNADTNSPSHIHAEQNAEAKTTSNNTQDN